jgi:hypothetical protein
VAHTGRQTEAVDSTWEWSSDPWMTCGLQMEGSVVAGCAWLVRLFMDMVGSHGARS